MSATKVKTKRRNPKGITSRRKRTWKTSKVKKVQILERCGQAYDPCMLSKSQVRSLRKAIDRMGDKKAFSSTLIVEVEKDSDFNANKIEAIKPDIRFEKVNIGGLTDRQLKAFSRYVMNTPLKWSPGFEVTGKRITL